MISLSSLKLKSMRYERKFLASDFDIVAIEAMLKVHPMGFSGIYSKRFVNSIYLDTINMTNYTSSEIGGEKRLKVRVRWYGNMIGYIKKPFIELKIKHTNLNDKIRFPLIPFTLGKNFSDKVLFDAIVGSEVPEFLKSEILMMQVVLLNRYTRKYFLTADKRFRLTLDWHLEFFSTYNFRNILLNCFKDEESKIIELKYGDNDDQNAHNVTSYFPFRVSKNSKYERGISICHL